VTDWIADTVARLEPLTTIGEAAKSLRTSTSSIRRLMAVGRIHAVRQRESGSSRVLIPRLEIERYLRGLSVGP
jgi:excisionase family DNA binding protein